MSLDSFVAVLIRLVVVVAAALVIQRAPVRAGAGAGPAHRFAVLAVWLSAVVVIGALLETELRRIVTEPQASYAQDYFAVAVPFALAVFLAATIVARPRLDRDHRPGLAMLAGPLAVVVLVLAASATMLRYWEADDEQTLQTAVETSGAAMQQAVATEMGIDLARSVGFGDTVSDVPFLSILGSAYVVDPDADLRAIATTKGWAIIES